MDPKDAWLVPDLSPGQVHVWLGLRPILPQGQLRAVLGLLSPDERQRASSFVSEQDAEAFVMARALLRTILAAHLHQDPTSLRFGYESAGKPFLDMEAPFDFNLSHSGPCVAIAVGATGPVGVDVERIRRLDRLDALARDVLAPEEHEYWIGAPEDGRLSRFFELWTAKEACLKAMGVGLGQDPRQTPVLGAGARPEAPGWGTATLDLVCLAAPVGYVAHLACPKGAQLAGLHGPVAAWEAILRTV